MGCTTERQISHNKMINTTEASSSFLIKLVYDLLPTPANKSKWFGKEELCTLCGGQGTLNHILSGCHIALSQGRYKWRHDKVLRELSNSIEVRLKENTGSTHWLLCQIWCYKLFVAKALLMWNPVLQRFLVDMCQWHPRCYHHQDHNMVEYSVHYISSWNK